VNYVLDTHVLIWYFTGSKRLKRRAKEAIDDCINRDGKLLVPKWKSRSVVPQWRQMVGLDVSQR
jgi:predicted nucleic acid-binding protein